MEELFDSYEGNKYLHHVNDILVSTVPLADSLHDILLLHAEMDDQKIRSQQ